MNDQARTKEELVTELQELRKGYEVLNASYEKVNLALTEAEEKLNENEFKLTERIKELHGIYSLGLAIEKFHNSEDVYKELVNVIIPKSMQFPDKVWALLEIDNQKFHNVDGTHTTSRREYLAAPIYLSGKYAGELQVGYIEDLPFIELFEQKLITAFAERISKFIEHKLAEEAHRENEWLLRASQEVARLGSFVWDFKNGLWTSSTILDDIFGIDDNYVRSLEGWAALVHPSWRKTMVDYVTTEVLAKHQSFNKEYKIINQKNGKELWVHGLAELELDKNNQPIKLIGTISDITVRKQDILALIESEANLNAIFNAADESIYLLTANETCIAVNEIGAKRLGRTLEETIGCKLSDLLPPEIEARRRPFTDRAILLGEKVTLEDERDGRWLVTNLYPIFNNDGKVTRLVIFSRDITDQKRLYAALRASEEKYSILLNGSLYGILAIDVETHRFLFSNPAICNLFGYTDEEFKRLSIVDLVPKESLDLVMSEFASQMSGNKSVSYSQPCIKKDGKVFYADIAGAPIIFNGRNCSVGFFIDVTDRKQSSELLQKSEEKFRSITEQLKDVVFITDNQGQVSYISPSAKLIFDYSPQEMTGEPFMRFLDENDVPNAMLQFRTSIESGSTRAVRTFLMKHKDGSTFIGELSSNVFYQDGQPIGTIGLIRDVTDKKHAEQELLNAKEKAEESDRLKSAFLANMSHEIRTPMNGIMGFAELLKEPNLTGEEQQKYLDVIRKSGKRMLNIIHDIVNISKIESGQMDVIISETNINEQLESVYELFAPEVEKRGLQLSVKNSMPSKNSRIKTDREKLYAILTNLVNNAIKFTSIGSIEFGYQKKGEYLVFFVKDTGWGIADHKKEVIFERFRQGSELITKPYEGAGLGLSISKAYVEMLGGKIWLESELGEGSTFYFTLPYNPESNTEFADKDVLTGKGAENQIRDLKILLVEDDEDTQQLMTEVLKKIGKELLLARTGIEAVEACRTNPDLDLVLMDIRMPDLDGYSSTRQIRQFNKDIIIIAQTAYGLEGDREKAMEAECNDYISKPISIDELKGLMLKYFAK